MGIRLVVNGKLYNESSNGGGGTSEHDKLDNRELDNQHPIEAIDGLKEKIEEYDNKFIDASESFSKIENDLREKFEEYDGKFISTSESFSEIENSLSGINDEIDNLNKLNHHTHDNLEILNNLTENAQEQLCYKGIPVGNSGGGSGQDIIIGISEYINNILEQKPDGLYVTINLATEEQIENMIESLWGTSNYITADDKSITTHDDLTFTVAEQL